MSNINYKSAGVDVEKENIILKYIFKTFSDTFRYSAWEPIIEMGYFASLLRISDDLALAISMDGVGTKLQLARCVGKFDTVGIDLVAMCVNDIICTGAEPIALLDYIGVDKIDERMLEELVDGIKVGACEASVAVVGGELAQVGVLLREFELVGTAIGRVNIGNIILGEGLQEGDVILGFGSNGIHSNGISLARKVLFDIAGFKSNSYIEELGTTIGEELLKPTHIYTKVILSLLKEFIPKEQIKGLLHITGGGFCNLKRVKSRVKFVLKLPEPEYIFSLIQKYGNIDTKHMYEVFNMSIGFCIIAQEGCKEKIKSIINSNNAKFQCFDLGYVVESNTSTEVLIETSKGEHISL